MRADLVEKFDSLARGFSARDYADPRAYHERRAQVTVEWGARLDPGDSVLDLGCGDGLFAPPLLDRGLRYHGVDGSPGMVEAARAEVGERATFEVGDLETYEPAEPFDAVTCFRAVYYVADRHAFFERVRSFTRTKFVFDFALRDAPKAAVVADLRRAGFADVLVRPLLSPQKYAPPRPVDALLRQLERTGPLVHPLMKLRFSYVVVAHPHPAGR